MTFYIASTCKQEVSDQEIFELLTHVYVEAGFTTAEVASKVFTPEAVRNRGTLFAARETSTNEFAGMIIVVPAGSSAAFLANSNECELHLLGVKQKYRRSGLGRELVSKAIEFAEKNNWTKIILWTQKSMKAAQNLYESFSFAQTGEMTKNGIEFLVYEKQLSSYSQALFS